MHNRTSDKLTMNHTGFVRHTSNSPNERISTFSDKMHNRTATQNGTLWHDKRSRQKTLIQIVFLVMGGDKTRVTSAEHLARHLRRPGEAPISFHLVTDKAWPSEMVEGWATPHLLSSMPAAALDLHANFSKITHGPGSMYMWKPLLPWLLPASITRVMVLDADLVLTRSVHELWAQFDAFGAGAAVGLAREQAQTYYDTLGPEAGVNGGVQLLHLGRMREADGAYQRELRRCATVGGIRRGDIEYIGFLGDQTLYSLMKKRTPSLFHTLPCGWNRQLSVHFFHHKEFKESHECRSSCGLVHGNQPAFKGMMPQMQTEGRPPTCDECRQGVAHLRKGNPHRDPQGYSAETLITCCCESNGLEG